MDDFEGQHDSALEKGRRRARRELFVLASGTAGLYNSECQAMTRLSRHMKSSRHSALVAKAVEAAVAAIEIYNKPSFQYREESFSILIINAWELILKARIVKENKNKMRSIEIWDREARAPGKKGRARMVPRQTRSGNNLTIGLQKSAEIVRGYKDGIDEICIRNLALLTEIRDSSIHFHNRGRALQKQLQEVGSAALKNFCNAATKWFGVELSR